MDIRIDGGPDCTHYRRLVYPISLRKKICDFCGKEWDLPELNFEGVFQPAMGTPSFDIGHGWHASIQTDIEDYKETEAWIKRSV